MLRIVSQHDFGFTFLPILTCVSAELWYHWGYSHLSLHLYSTWGSNFRFDRGPTFSNLFQPTLARGEGSVTGARLCHELLVKYPFVFWWVLDGEVSLSKRSTSRFQSVKNKNVRIPTISQYSVFHRLPYKVRAMVFGPAFKSTANTCKATRFAKNKWTVSEYCLLQTCLRSIRSNQINKNASSGVVWAEHSH